MTWTYSLALDDSRDQIRLLIGDTDSDDQQLQDEEIDYFLGSEANARMAASLCAAAIGSRYARKADKAVGDLKISYKGIAQQYRDLAVELKGYGMMHQLPTAGGIKVSETQAYEGNSALRHGAVKRSMTDYVATSPTPNTEGS